MTVRFISILVANVSARQWNLRAWTGTGAIALNLIRIITCILRPHIRAGDPLVGIRRLFGDDTSVVAVGTMVRRATGATAGAEQPKQTAGKRERHRKPCNSKHMRTQAGFNFVWFEPGVDGTSQCGKEGGCGDSRGNGENRGDLIIEHHQLLDFDKQVAGKSNIPRRQY